MPSTENEIVGCFASLREMVNQLAGADLPSAESEKVKALANIALRIAESLVIDINLIAFRLGEVVEIQRTKAG